MQFKSNAFIVSTIALLSLITPVVNASVAAITTPATGETLMVYDSIYVKWTITNSQGLDDVTCDIALVHVDSDPSIPISPGILESGVPILNRISDAPVPIPDVESGNKYYMELISPDEKIVYGQSGLFSIV